MRGGRGTRLTPCLEGRAGSTNPGESAETETQGSVATRLHKEPRSEAPPLVLNFGVKYSGESEGGFNLPDTGITHPDKLHLPKRCSVKTPPPSRVGRRLYAREKNLCSTVV